MPGMPQQPVEQPMVQPGMPQQPMTQPGMPQQSTRPERATAHVRTYDIATSMASLTSSTRVGFERLTRHVDRTQRGQDASYAKSDGWMYLGLSLFLLSSGAFLYGCVNCRFAAVYCENWASLC